MNSVATFRPAPTTQRVRSVVARAEPINSDIRKDEPKVVDMFKASDLPKKAVFCRCWKSGTFPMCDGSHVAHNKDTGDNVGPLIVDMKDD